MTPSTERASSTKSIACADLMLASTADERAQLVDAVRRRRRSASRSCRPASTICVFSPGDRDAARRRLGIDAARVLLFVGRIQPLKGLDLAVRSLATLADPSVVLVVVGGPSGPDGESELKRVRALADAARRRRPHSLGPAAAPHLLADYYRAADVCLVPSHAESFGLVALEAAACATPVVAAAVGGLAFARRRRRDRFPRRQVAIPADFAVPVEKLLGRRATAPRLRRATPRAAPAGTRGA